MTRMGFIHMLIAVNITVNITVSEYYCEYNDPTLPTKCILIKLVVFK